MTALPLPPTAILIYLLLSPHLAVRKYCLSMNHWLDSQEFRIVLAQSRCSIKMLGEKKIKGAREGTVLGSQKLEDKDLATNLCLRSIASGRVSMQVSNGHLSRLRTCTLLGPAALSSL